MPVTGFTSFPYFQYLENCNSLGAGRPVRWRFYPGMLFGNLEKWWPDAGPRPTAHEGLDICYYTDALGEDLQFDPGVRVPVMTAGTVLALCDDFLGRSVFLAHGQEQEPLISVYAHIRPLAAVGPGFVASAGEVIGTVADTAGRRNRMPAHLHLTIMKIPAGVPAASLDWTFICRSDMVTLFDPLTKLFCPSYRILS